jgi:hypothetical protein
MAWKCKLCGEVLDDSDFWNHMFDDHESDDVKELLAVKVDDERGRQ